MSPIESKPSKNEEEYFAKANADHIKAMRAKLDEARAESERRSHLMRCPRCGGHLAARDHHHMRIDVCPDCGGTWLDKGELEMLEHVDQSNIRRFIGDLFGLKD
ncbi:MAG: zf-TFIIB domain-containing protein [Gemmatirosa sp.]|nr:zf-TFIIB domain-containing protein [Gemmatirosa sp.]